MTVNRAPFGGDLLVTHSALLVALDTPIELEAREWADDPEDLPLEYSFMRESADLYRGSAPWAKQSALLGSASARIRPLQSRLLGARLAAPGSSGLPE